MTTTTGNKAMAGDGLNRAAAYADRAATIVRAVAPASLVQLVMRLALAAPFFKSGILKWDDFLTLSDTAVYLFSDEFKLHLPGGPYSFPAPAVMAALTGSAEIVLPVLLALGLATRVAASCLLVMTAVVQLTVPTGWPVHLTWAAMALGIMAWGPGRLSVDHWLGRLWRGSADRRSDR